MAGRMHRTQILLEPEQHRALAEIAQGEGRSVSELVRELVRRELEQRRGPDEAKRKRQLDALERIRQHREQILASRGGKPLDIDIVAMINQGREERDEQILRAIRESGRAIRESGGGRQPGDLDGAADPGADRRQESD